MRRHGHANGESIAALAAESESVTATRRVDENATAPPRRSSMLRALGVTFVAQIVVGGATVLLYRLLAIKLGTDGFANYALVKQGVTLLLPVVTMGLMGGLPRYIALGSTRASPSAEAYLVAAVGICGVVTLATAGAALLFPGLTAAVLFGDRDAIPMVPAFAALLVATAAFWLAYGYFRGQLRVTRGNSLQIVGVGVLPPVLVLLLPDIGISALVLLMAAGLGALSLGTLIVPLLRGALGAARGRVGTAGRLLLDYGARRVPGEIAQVGLFALVPVLAAHVASLREVAYLAAGLQIMAMLAMALTPVGVVLLPTLARGWADDPVGTSRQVATLAGMATHVGIFIFGQALLFADVVVHVWLGEQFAEAGAVVRVTVLAMPLFAFYLIMRSSLDAASVRSYNSRSNLVAMVVFALVAASSLSLSLIPPVFCVAWAFATGVAVQGGLTFLSVHRLFRLEWSDYALRTVLPLVLLTGALGFAARPLIEATGAGLALLLGLEIVLAAIFFGGLALQDVAWIRLLRERLSRGRPEKSD